MLAHGGHLTTMSDEQAGLAGRYEDVKRRIHEAALRAGRDPDRIFLVAVTKTATLEQIRTLLRLGHADFGEGRMQQLVRMASQLDEYVERQRELHDSVGLPEQIRWHFIGHLQRNKARRVMQRSQMIHSVDSLRLAEEIQQSHRGDGAPTQVLIQVNIAAESAKYGVAPAAAKHLVDQVDTMVGVQARGLMCMAPLEGGVEAARPVFDRGRELFEDIQKSTSNRRFDILSMGMSADFETAVECGANVVRVGTAIFGTPQGEQCGTQVVTATPEPLV